MCSKAKSDEAAGCKGRGFEQLLLYGDLEGSVKIKREEQNHRSRSTADSWDVARNYGIDHKESAIISGSLRPISRMLRISEEMDEP